MANMNREQWLAAKTHSDRYTNAQLVRMHELYMAQVDSEAECELNGRTCVVLSIASYDKLYAMLETADSELMTAVTNVLLYKHNVYECDAANDELYKMLHEEAKQ